MRQRALTSAASLVICMALIGVFGQGCSTPSAPPATVRYALRTIRGEVLPAAMDRFVDSHGVTRVIEVLSATVTFNQNGSFDYAMDARRTFDGAVVELLPAAAHGTWERNDSTYVARFTNRIGEAYTFRYEIGESGQVVQSIEFNDWVYRWTRVDSLP